MAIHAPSWSSPQPLAVACKITRMGDSVTILWIIVSGVLLNLAILSPLWVPVALLALAIWKRRYSLAFLLMAIAAEAISLFASRTVLEFLAGFDK